MHRLLIVSAAALALAACGNNNNQPQGAAAPAEQAATPDANTAATAPTAANEAGTPDFVMKAAAGDMFEIQSSQLAVERTQNADVRAFAQMMITAHQGTTRALQAAIASSGQTLTPPTALPSDLQGKLDSLRAATPADFDRAYLDAQVEAHQNALNVMQRYAQDGDVAAIKAFAAETAPAVQQHLERVRALRDGMH